MLAQEVKAEIDGQATETECRHIVSPKLIDASIFNDDQEAITQAILADEEAALRALPAIKAKMSDKIVR